MDIYSEYYGEYVSIAYMQKAMYAYEDWCEKEGLTPEIEPWQVAMNLSGEQVDHVLYHYREVIKK